MNGAEFVAHLNEKYYPELEGPIIAVRKALAELDPSSPAFVDLMQRQAKKEEAHAVAFTKALDMYPELNEQERSQVAEQAAEEHHHYELIREYLQNRGIEFEDDPGDAYSAYFDRFLAGDVKAFRLCNIAEKSAVAFFMHMGAVTTDPAVRKLVDSIMADEADHGDSLVTKLSVMASDEGERDFLERHFVESWSSQKTGVFLEAEELGVDVKGVLAKFSQG